MGGLWSAAALFEEGAEEGGGLVSQDSGGVGVGVVQSGVGGKVVEGAGGACFGVRGGVDEAADAGGVEGAGAHGAGLQGGVEGAAGEAPRLELLGGAAEGEEFGVGGRISGGFALVMGGRYDLLSSDDYRSYGDFALFGGPRGFFEGTAHHYKVSFFELFRVFRFQFFRHGVDNSNTACAWSESGADVE